MGRVRVRVSGVSRGFFCSGGCRSGGLGACEFDGGAGAVIERQDEAAVVGVEGDDGTDEPNPFDGVVVVEVEVLACSGGGR